MYEQLKVEKKMIIKLHLKNNDCLANRDAITSIIQGKIGKNQYSVTCKENLVEVSIEESVSDSVLKELLKWDFFGNKLYRVYGLEYILPRTGVFSEKENFDKGANTAEKEINALLKKENITIDEISEMTKTSSGFRIFVPFNKITFSNIKKTDELLKYIDHMGGNKFTYVK